MALDAGGRSYIEFQPTDTSEVVEAIDVLIARGDGSWVNIEPIIERDDLDGVRRPNPILRLFSYRGPMIPFATLVSASTRGRRPEPAQVGLQHGAGQQAVAQLAAAGVEPPAGWVLLDDSPRRGMVYRLPQDEAVGVIVDWVIAAGTALSQVPIRSHWSAVTHAA